MPGLHLLRVEEIVDDLQPAFADRSSRGAAAFGRVVAADADTAKIVVDVPTAADDMDDVRGRIVPSDPGHLEAAVVHERRTDLVEQLIARGHSHDGLVDL